MYIACTFFGLLYIEQYGYAGSGARGPRGERLKVLEYIG
jgi:hypothetical protein